MVSEKDIISHPQNDTQEMLFQRHQVKQRRLVMYSDGITTTATLQTIFCHLFTYGMLRLQQPPT